VSDGVELGGVEAVQVVFGEATGAHQVGEHLGQDGVAVVELVIDPAALLAQPVLQVPEFRGFRDPRGARSLASRMTASSSRLRARSKALRAAAFSAGDHFQSRIVAIAGLCALAMFRFSLGGILARAGRCPRCQRLERCLRHRQKG